MKSPEVSALLEIMGKNILIFLNFRPRNEKNRMKVLSLIPDMGNEWKLVPAASSA